MAEIHPTAVVAAGAQLGADVRIGPYCIVGPEVVLGPGVELISHAVVTGRTTIGRETSVHPFTAVGTPPQDMKYDGEPSELVVGDRNVLREQVTINPGTRGGGMVTRVGDDCLFMVGAHVAHDCTIGDHVVLANNVALAGHVEVQDFAILGGLSGIHQFVRIGKHAMVGGASAVDADVIPYGSVMGNRAWLTGLNLIGLKRRGFKSESVNALRDAYRMLFAENGTMGERIEHVASRFETIDAVIEIVDFIRQPSNRGICQPQRDGIG